MENEWQAEPNFMFGVCYSLPCVIIRNKIFGTLNGYVGIASGHALYRRDYSDLEQSFDVHGCLNFSALDSFRGFKNYWFFGFHCNHYRDFAPFLAGVRYKYITSLQEGAIYRNMQYVQDECKGLAAQLSNNKIDHVFSDFLAFDIPESILFL